MIGWTLLSALTLQLGTYMHSEDGWALRRTPSGQCNLTNELLNGTTAVVSMTGPDTTKTTLFLFNTAWASIADKGRVPIRTVIDKVVTEGFARVEVIANTPGVRMTVPTDILVGTVGAPEAPTNDIQVFTGASLLGVVPSGAPGAIRNLIICSTGSTDPFAGK